MIDPLLEILTIKFVWALGASILGGVIYGYTGWGSGLMLMPILSLLFGPAEALAILSIGGIMVTAQLLPKVIGAVTWRPMAAFYVLLFVATPIGSLTLLQIDPDLARRFVGGFVILGTIVLASGWRFKGRPGLGAGSTFGIVSGFINGFVGVGGPAMVIYILAIPQAASSQRANILIGSGIMTTLIAVTLSFGGNVGVETLLRGILLGPAQMIGASLGARMFVAMPQELFRRITLILLVLLGIATVLV